MPSPTLSEPLLACPVILSDLGQIYGGVEESWLMIDVENLSVCILTV